MELTQLYQFQAIAEEQSVSKAAERLYVSQPALSKSLKKLEDELGVQLFDRERGRLTLNSAGRILLHFAETVENAEAQMHSDLTNLEDGVHILRIGSPHVALLRYAIPLYGRQHKSSVRFSPTILPEDEARSEIRSGLIQLAILSAPISLPGFKNVFLGMQRTMISVPRSNPLSSKKSIALEDLKNQPFLSLGKNKAAPWAMEFYETLHREKIPTRTIEFDDFYLYNEMLKSTECLALSTTVSMRTEPRNPDRKYLPLDNDPYELSLYAVYHEEHAEKVQPFVTWMTENITLP